MTDYQNQHETCIVRGADRYTSRPHKLLLSGDMGGWLSDEAADALHDLFGVLWSTDPPLPPFETKWSVSERGVVCHRGREFTCAGANDLARVLRMAGIGWRLSGGEELPEGVFRTPDGRLCTTADVALRLVEAGSHTAHRTASGYLLSDLWLREMIPTAIVEVRPCEPPAPKPVQIQAEAIEVVRAALMERWSDDLDMERIAEAAHAAARALVEVLPERGRPVSGQTLHEQLVELRDENHLYGVPHAPHEIAVLMNDLGTDVLVLQRDRIPCTCDVNGQMDDNTVNAAGAVVSTRKVTCVLCGGTRLAAGPLRAFISAVPPEDQDGAA